MCQHTPAYRSFMDDTHTFIHKQIVSWLPCGSSEGLYPNTIPHSSLTHVSLPAYLPFPISTNQALSLTPYHVHREIHTDPAGQGRCRAPGKVCKFEEILGVVPVGELTLFFL